MAMTGVPSGDSRESVAFAIVMQLAAAEGKLPAGGGTPRFDRQWLFDAFTFAWRCLGDRGRAGS